jgi:hypothetical protein
MELSGNFLEKNTPNNNFLTVQPISANSILIDLVQQVEESEHIKNISQVFEVSNPEFSNTKYPEHTLFNR